MQLTFTGKLLGLCLLIGCIASAAGVAPCDKDINLDKDPTGVITSPDTELGQVCQFVFAATAETELYLVLDSLHLSDADTLTFYNGSVTMTNVTVIQNFSGIADVASDKKLVYSLAPNTTVVFRRSNDSSRQSGFFQVSYMTNKMCSIQVSPALRSAVVLSPYYVRTDRKLSCNYTFTNEDATSQFALSFPQVNLVKGSVKIVNADGEAIGMYKDGTMHIGDMFVAGSSVTFVLELATSDISTWSSAYDLVSKNCSGNVTVGEKFDIPFPMDSDGNYLNNLRCRWVISNTQNRTYLLQYVNLGFKDAGDYVTVSDGNSKFAPSLGDIVSDTTLQFTSGSSFTVVFNTDESGVDLGVIMVAQALAAGGKTYVTEPGTIIITATSPLTNETDIYVLFDTMYSENKVLLTIVNATMFPKNEILCYDGSTYYGPTHPHLVANLTTFDPFHEIFSSGSQLLCIFKHFLDNNTEFAQINYTILTGNNMINSYDLSGAYRLESDQLTANVTWIIHSPDSANVMRIWSSELQVLPTCQVTISQGLDDLATPLAKINSSYQPLPLFPVIYIPGDGARVTYECTNLQKAREQGEVVIAYQGYYSNIPVCGSLMNTSAGLMQSPIYPDNYPYNAKCTWTVPVPEQKFVHVFFDEVKLVLNHTATVSWTSANATADNTSTEVVTFSGVGLPADIIKPAGQVDVVFSSEANNVVLTGFVGGQFSAEFEILDCGGLITSSSSSLSTPDYPAAPNRSLTCVWIVQLPSPKSKKSVNIVSYKLTIKGFKEGTTSDLKIVDGGTYMNSSAVTLKYQDGTSDEKLSRLDTVIIQYSYKAPEEKKTGTPYAFKLDFKTHECTDLCKNGICKHDDWVCNGVDDCGDNSDETNCKIIKKGKLGAITALVVILSILAGVVLAVFGPKLYRRIRNRNYTQFSDPVSTTA